MRTSISTLDDIEILRARAEQEARKRGLPTSGYSIPFHAINVPIPSLKYLKVLNIPVQRPMGNWQCQICHKEFDEFDEASQCHHKQLAPQLYPMGTYATSYYTEKEGKAILGLGRVTEYDAIDRTYTLSYLHDTNFKIYDVEEKYMHAKVALAKLFDFMGVKELP